MTDFDHTTDWTPPGEAESAVIRDYFDRGSARAQEVPSPLFAGRDDLLEGVREDLRRLRRSPIPLPNLTWVAYGAPGAGKSEALLHLAMEFSRWVEGDSPVLVVPGDRDILTDPLALGEAVYKADGLDPDAVANKLVQIEYGGSMKVAKATATYERRARRPATLMGWVGRAINRDCRGPTILLLVDEAQGELEEAVAGGTPTFVRAMHKGALADLKILPVYGGLGDTVKRLSDAGVSRLDVGHAQHMRPLPGSVAGNICRKALCALTRPPDQASVDRWAAGIVRLCEGWPMHLTHCFLAVLGRHRDAPDRTFTDEDFGVAMERADALRRDYYDARLSSCDGLDPEHYEAWGRLFAGGAMANPAEVAKVLALSRPEAKDLLEKALRAGLVESTKPHWYQSPIPSLARHMVEAGRLHASHRPPRRPATDLGRWRGHLP